MRMRERKGINPCDPHQALLFFSMDEALDELGEEVSPIHVGAARFIRMAPHWRIVELLGRRHGFRKIGWEGCPLVDGIYIWIEFDGSYPEGLPSYLRDAPWRPVNPS